MIKNLFKIILLSGFAMLFLQGSLMAQNAQVDSLKNILSQSKNDSNKVLLLNDLSTKILMEEEDIDGSIKYSKQAFQLADSINYLKGQAYALKNIGLAEYYRENVDQVFINWTNSLKIFESIKDDLGIANLVGNLGVIHYNEGNHETALDYYLKSLRISEKLKDTVRISTALVNMGGLYIEMKDYEKALDQFEHFNKFRSKLNDPGFNASYFMGTGEVYRGLGDHTKAIEYFSEALTINKDTEDYAHNLTMLGREEYSMGNREKALEYLELAYTTAKSSNSNIDQVQTLLVFGEIFKESDFSKSLKAYKEAEEIALKLEAKDELRNVYQGMSTVYYNAGDFKQAYFYQNKFIELKDLIFNTETSNRIKDLQFNFDLGKKEDEIGLLEKDTEILKLNEKRQKIVKYISFVIGGFILLFAIGLFKRFKYVEKTKKIIEEEKTRSDNLLLNILPEETALELKANGKVKAKKFESTTVLFTDFKGFTHYAENLSPEKLVETIDFYFSKFDLIMEKYDLEKIKTVGDAYMCAGGLHANIEDHSHKMLLAALEIMEFVQNAFDNKTSESTLFEVRIGVNSGPVVAGVVGTHKFAYDIWGDTVNVASRMESNAEAGKINISENTYQLVKDDFDCVYRGELAVKNRGKMRMYYVNGLKSEKKRKDIKHIEIEV